MSRIGRMPITVPASVTAELQGGEMVVKGPKGQLKQAIPAGMSFERQDGTLLVQRASESREHRALHGLTRSLVNNMIIGVTDGYTKALEISGTGYRAALSGKQLTLSLGYSHPIQVTPPAGITFAVEGQTRVLVSGIDKQQVGEIAAQIRRLRKPEPYKGKGVRYADEVIRRKAGKAGKVGAKKK
jgi:large subunit ribosomal protein L6